LGKPHRLKKLLEQNNAGMGGYSVFGYHDDMK
jgi:hypothetical protein